MFMKLYRASFCVVLYCQSKSQHIKLQSYSMSKYLTPLCQEWLFKMSSVCYRESRDELRLGGKDSALLCWYRARREGRGEAQREGERERENMREPKRAEERKSIPIQSESDKPEQCIVQTHSITQSYTHTRVHVEAFAQTYAHACVHTHSMKCACRPSIKMHYKPHKAQQPLKSNDITTLDCFEDSLT